MIEMLDIYDDNMHHIGTKARSDVHRDGDWHKVFHCWVIYRDEQGEDWIVLQKRGATTSYANMLDVSAAGHYEAGETAREGVRELAEELGLCPQFEELIPIGRRITFSGYAGLKDREIAEVFFYVCNQPLAAYRCHPIEVAGLVALNIRQGLQLYSGEICHMKVPAYGLGCDTMTITREHLLETLDHYWEKVLLLASRCLNGERKLWI